MKMDKAKADSIIDQLAHAKELLAVGRAYGIRVIATREAVDGLMQSTHPDAQQVVANIAVSDRIDGIL